MDPFDLNPSLLTPRHMKLKQKFDSAKSLDGMLKTLKDLEAHFKENDLGFAYWKLTLKYHLQMEENSEQVLFFGKKVLDIIVANSTRNHGCSSSDSGLSASLQNVGVLQILGNSCFKLIKFDESLGYFNWAVQMLEILGRDTSNNHIVLRNLQEVEHQIFTVKYAMGEISESFSHLVRKLEITKKISGENSKELAKANMDLSDFHFEEGRFEEARYFCVKAKEIYTMIYGVKSKEVAESMKQLAGIYCGLGECDKGLKENQLSQKVLKNLGCNSILLKTEIEGACILKQMGRYTEAVESFKDIVPRTEKLSNSRSLVLTSMAEALCQKNILSEAKTLANKVCVILYKLEKSNTLDVALGFGRIAVVYEIGKEYDTAISLLKRVDPILKKLSDKTSHPHLLDVPLRIGQLLVLVGKAENAIPYIEKGIETRKKSLGTNHSKLGSAYKLLGNAYLELNKLSSAVQAFVHEKNILDESFGLHHKKSIDACKKICRLYTAMGSYTLAINIMEELIGRLKEMGSSEQEELDQANRFVAELRIDAAESLKNNASVVGGFKEQEPHSNVEYGLDKAGGKLLETSQTSKSKKKKKKKSTKKDDVLESFMGLTTS